MKLLIVDDEELTRNGLISALDWESFGITEVYQADDGVNGLASALKHRPDIVLCDVRMPRMDGIIMLKRIQTHLPDVCGIFMSGYSDKEYLKAAIQLKAIHYIEKPIDLKELETAIVHAIEQHEQKSMQHHAEVLQSNLDAAQLALLLTNPYNSCHETIEKLCSEYPELYSAELFKYAVTFILKLEQPMESSSRLSYIYQVLSDFLSTMHLHVICSEKRLFHIVYHIYGPKQPGTISLNAISERLAALFSPFGNYYIAIGDAASGISNVCHSYESAVILLQSSFFFAPGTILTSDFLKEASSADMNSLLTASQSYQYALSEHDADAALEALTHLNTSCSHASNLMPNQIKSIYYDLFSALYQTRRNQKLSSDVSIENHENIMDIMESCFSFSILHTMLLEKTKVLFSDMEHATQENSMIYLIRSYIAEHYKDTGLSVRDISEYARLSASYACTFFKNETGMTLNQYITEFRMEKAKHLLSDPRCKITDVSAAVGYSDGNYFGKSFRKYTGLSPSEYRENVSK